MNLRTITTNAVSTRVLRLPVFECAIAVHADVYQNRVGNLTEIVFLQHFEWVGLGRCRQTVENFFGACSLQKRACSLPKSENKLRTLEKHLKNLQHTKTSKFQLRLGQGSEQGRDEEAAGVGRADTGGEAGPFSVFGNLDLFSKALVTAMTQQWVNGICYDVLVFQKTIINVFPNP